VITTKIVREKERIMAQKFKIQKGKGFALAVIDMQRDFLPGGKLPVDGVKGEPTAEVLIQRINMLMTAPFDHVLLSRDVHPANHIECLTIKPHCLIMSEGAELSTDLRPPEEREIITKGYEPSLKSFSIATSTSFATYIGNLRAKQIKIMLVCDLAYNFCVGGSAVDYAIQGFETYVIRDATRSVPPPYGPDPEEMDRKLEAFGVKLIKFEDLI